MFDTALTVETEHRLGELERYRAQFRDPEDAWFATVMRNRGPAIDLSGLRDAVRTIVLAVANLF